VFFNNIFKYLLRFRYTLVMSDADLLGKRRAAQRVAAAVLAELQRKGFTTQNPPSENDVLDTAHLVIETMVSSYIVNKIRV